MSSTLKNKREVSVMGYHDPSSKSPFWKSLVEHNTFQASKLDKAGIKFAMIEGGNLLSIYVSEEDFEKAKEALNE